MKSLVFPESVKKLLPEDTRALELASCAILFGLGFSLNWIWIYAGASLFALCIFACCTNNYNIRTATSLIAGGMFLLQMSLVPTGALIVQMVLGMSNLYAFLLNNQGSKWI